MAEIKENNSILKACGYCLKVFKSSDKSEIGCDDCRLRIDGLIRQEFDAIIPKTLEKRIKQLEEEVKKLKEKS